MKNVVAFLTQNQKLLTQLQTALKHLIVVRVENIEAVNITIKHQPVGAVVLHVTNISAWIIFELLKTAYPDIPRFAILAPSLSKEDFDREKLAAKYGAAGIANEKNGVQTLASMIQVQTAAPLEVFNKETYLEVYGEIWTELQRLNNEFTIMGMRTLPQPEIGTDTQERLKMALKSLKKVNIQP